MFRIIKWHSKKPSLPEGERVGCSANIYELYVGNRRAAARYVAPVSQAQRGEFSIIVRWNVLWQESGTEAVSRWLAPDKFAVEIIDLNDEPSWVAYPVGPVWQIDEYDGTSLRTPTLAAALSSVRRL
jgi:hypothetical protein